MTIDEHSQHPFTPQTRRARIEDLETNAIEAHQAVEGAEPKIAIGRLRYRSDAVVREPLLNLPGVDRVFSNGAKRNNNTRRDADPQKEGGDNKSESNPSFPSQIAATPNAPRK